MILRIKNISDNMDRKVLIRSKQSDSDTLYPFQLLFFDKEFDLHPNHSIDFESIDSAKEFATELYKNENIEWQETTLNQLRQEFFTHILKSFLAILVQVWSGILYLKNGLVSLWSDKIAKFIPYTKQYRYRSFWKKIQLTRERLSKFRQLESIPPEKRKSLQRILLKKENPIIDNELMLWRIGEIQLALAATVAIISYCGGSITVINNWLHINWGFAVGIISFLTFSLFGLWLLLAEEISFLLGKFIDISFLSRLNVIFSFAFLIGYPSAFYFYSDTIRFYSQNVWISGLFLGGLNFCILYSSALITIFIGDVLQDLSENQLKIFYPEIMFAHSALDILSKMQENIKKGKGIENKQFLLSRIETLATHLEKNILYKIRYQDNSTKLWAKAEVKKMSFAIRAMKKNIILPEHQGAEVFQEKMSHLLIASLTGAWGEFPKIENSQEPSFFQNIGVAFSFVIRTLISATLPAIIWIGFQKSSFAIASPISDYVNVGLLLWGILSILAALDPSFSMKINSIKDLTQIISSKK